MNAIAAIPLPRQTLLLGSKVCMTLALFYMGEPLNVDDLWAGLCLVGALYFIFRSAGAGAPRTGASVKLRLSHQFVKYLTSRPPGVRHVVWQTVAA